LYAEKDIMNYNQQIFLNYFARMLIWNEAKLFSFFIQRIGLSLLLFFLNFLLIAQNKSTLPFKKVGPVYLLRTQEKEAVLSVCTAKWHDSVVCKIQLQDAYTDQILKERAVVCKDSFAHEQIIGTLGNKLWMFVDSLVGYDILSLEPIASEHSIILKNPFMRDNFPRYSNAYLMDEAAEVIYITAANGDRYKLYDEDFLMKPDDTQSDSAPDNYKYEYAAEYTVNDRYLLKYALSNVDTSNGMLYILGSEKEGAQVLNYFGSSVYNEQEEMRQMILLPFKLDGEQIDYANNTPIMSSKKYFKAGFLQRKFYENVWRGMKGERIIIFETSKLICVAMVDKGGNELWTANTRQAATHFADYLIGEQNLVLWFQGKEEMRISLDIATGKIATP
jgi:hypothetical protein